MLLTRSLIAAALGSALLSAQTTSWRYYRPGNTGIQGDSNEAVFVGADGDPYIGGYDAGFEEGGFAKFVQAQNRWINYSNIDYPVIGHPNTTGTTRVSDIVADPSGVLWMSTWRGALRFDPALGANSIVNYAATVPALANGGARDVDRAPDGTLWFALVGFGGSQGGLVRHTPATNTWKYWTGGATPQGGNGWPQLVWNVAHVSVQPKPTGGYLVWCDSDNSGATVTFDSATQSFTTADFEFTPGSILELPGKDCTDESGNFWARRFAGFSGSSATYTLDYRKPDGTWVSPAQLAASTEAWAFKAFGDRQALLVDGNSVVHRFNGASWQNYGAWKSGAFSSSIDIDAQGNVWVCGTGGAAKRNAQSGIWQRYRVSNTSQYDSFNNDLTLDPTTGNVWASANAGSGIGGLTSFDGVRWTGFNDSTYGLGKPWPFPTDNSEAVGFRPSTGRVVANPMYNGLHEWNGASWTNLNGMGTSKGLVEDSLGRLWSLGEYYSLQVHNGASWTQVGITAWGSKLQQDPERPGTVWAATGHEIKRTDGTYSFSREIGDFPELTTQSDTFSGLAADKNGVAWIGASVQFGAGGTGGALIRLDANTGAYQMLRYDQGWPLPGQFVSPLAVTPDGKLWMQYDTDFLTAQRGLCWYDGTNVGVFPAPAGGEPQWGGLPHAQIADLEVRPITGGYELWMSCKSRGLAVLSVLDPAAVTSYGCGTNPSGSLVASGTPALGKSLQLALDNPLGTQAVGALPLLALSAVGLANPCGVALPGWNMNPGAPAGEWLLAAPFFAQYGGPAWQGSGHAVSFALAVPADPTLIGVRVYAQGALVDASGTGPLIGLSEGRTLRIGL
jgi:sugar lactone lactonase YvrE